MIVAAGLTPAWQQTVVVEHLRKGEVHRAKQVVWCASGKVVNVGVALRLLDVESRTVVLLGGPNKAAMEADLQALGVSASVVESQTTTRVCTTILEQTGGSSTELVENAGSIQRAEWEQFTRRFAGESAKASFVVLTGSLPEGTPTHFYADLLETTAARAILDIRGDELRQALPHRPFLVKPNREELQKTLGRELKSQADLWSAMREIVAGGASWIVVTQGAGPVLAMSEDAELVLEPIRVERVVNSIGCGDCLAAGIAAALDRGLEVPRAVCYGMAVAAKNLAELLPARFNPTDLSELAASVRIGTRD